MAVIEKKAGLLKSAKQSNAFEIISYLDLFEGKISYTEITNMPIPVLTELVEAKQVYDAEKAKAAQKKADEINKKREREEQQARAKSHAATRKAAKKR